MSKTKMFSARWRRAAVVFCLLLVALVLSCLRRRTD